MLTGSDTLTVSGQLTWTGGTMSGTGTTIAQDTLQIGLPADTDDGELLDGRTLSNAGAATWAGGGAIYQTDGGTFVNSGGASLTIDNDLTWSSDGTGTFNNAGISHQGGRHRQDQADRLPRQHRQRCCSGRDPEPAGWWSRRGHLPGRRRRHARLRQ